MKNFGFSRHIFLLFSFLFIITNSFCQWPQWRGPSRNGKSTEAGLLREWPTEGPRLAWSVDLVGDGFSSATIQDQMVFTQGKKDSVEILSALDLKGNVKWQNTIGRALTTGEWQQSRSTPTFYKNKIYAVSALGDVACFDALTGKRDWNIKVIEKFDGDINCIAESPLVINDKVIITPGGYQTTMVALDRVSGRTLWRSESLRDSNYFGTPIPIKGKNKNYVFQSSKLYDFIVDPDNGTIIWKDLRAGGNYVPQPVNDQIYFPGSERGGSLCRWNEELNKRSFVWSDTVRALVISGSAVIGDWVIVSCLPRGICSIDIKTGKPVARYTRLRTCNFLVAGNQLYCYEDGTARVYLFNVTANGFELVSSFKTASGSGPAIAHMSLSNGLLFLRRGNVLMAYDVSG